LPFGSGASGCLSSKAHLPMSAPLSGPGAPAPVSGQLSSTDGLEVPSPRAGFLLTFVPRRLAFARHRGCRLRHDRHSLFEHPVPGREFRVPYGRPTEPPPGGLDPAGVSVFPTHEIRPGWVPPILRGGGVLPTSDGSLIGTCRFTTASPVIRLTQSTGGSHDYEACGDSPTFTRPVFPSPAAAGWNGNRFGFYPGLRTPRLPTTHAKAGTVPRTLDRVMSSTSEPPNNMTTHVVRPHVAPHRS
jgi:hypothetical protein